MTLFNCVGLSRSHIYFKMLRKFLCKFPVLKILTLTPSYFKSNLFQRQTYLVRKKMFPPLFIIFFILAWIILSSLERFIHGKFYSWKTLSSLENLSVKNLIKSSVENFIWYVEFYPVQRILFSVENFIQCVEFYPVLRILSGVHNVIQCIDFYLCREFYPMSGILSSAQNFIQCREFYPVQRILSSVQNFFQC